MNGVDRNERTGALYRADGGAEGVSDDAQIVGRSLLGLINDILDFSKIEAGKLNWIGRHFCLRETIAAVAKAVAFRAGEKGVEASVLGWRTTFPTDGLGMRVACRQVLTNLLFQRGQVHE